MHLKAHTYNLPKDYIILRLIKCDTLIIYSMIQCLNCGVNDTDFRICSTRYNTIIHCMSPITKLIILICMSTLISLYWDPRFLSILTIIVAIIYIISKTPLKWMLIAIWCFQFLLFICLRIFAKCTIFHSSR